MKNYTIGLFGYCQDEHGVYLLQGSVNQNTIRIVQTMIGNPNDLNTQVIFTGTIMDQIPPVS